MRTELVLVVSVLALAGITLAQEESFAPDPVYPPPPTFDCPCCDASFSSQPALDAHLVYENSLPSGMEFVTIPPGTFLMGSPSSVLDGYEDEFQHWVTVESFELMTTEVTQGMWEEVMGVNPSHGCGEGEDYPVYYVSWEDCRAFIEAMNVLDPSHVYRLPSESEWEYACRAGTTTVYYWGNTMSGSYFWYDENSNDSSQPAGRKLPNAWGLYDMSGNVWEWCQDTYTSDYRDCPSDGTAYTGEGSGRVERGGSWSGAAQYCRSANRNALSRPGGSHHNLGLRLARTAL